MSVPIQPLASYVVAEQEEAASKTASGLYLPDNAKEKPHVAKVLAVGADIKDIKAGDRIIYGGYTNETIEGTTQCTLHFQASPTCSATAHRRPGL